MKIWRSGNQAMHVFHIAGRVRFGYLRVEGRLEVAAELTDGGLGLHGDTSGSVDNGPKNIFSSRFNPCVNVMAGQTARTYSKLANPVISLNNPLSQLQRYFVSLKCRLQYQL